MIYLRCNDFKFKIYFLDCFVPRCDAKRNSKLILVGGKHFAFDAQGGFGGVGVRHDGEVTALETVMTRAVVGHLDATCLAWGDRLAGIVAHGATAT